MTHHYHIDPIKGNNSNSGYERESAMATAAGVVDRFLSERKKGDGIMITIHADERITV